MAFPDISSGVWEVTYMMMAMTRVTTELCSIANRACMTDVIKAL